MWSQLGVWAAFSWYVTWSSVRYKTVLPEMVTADGHLQPSVQAASTLVTSPITCLTLRTDRQP